MDKRKKSGREKREKTASPGILIYPIISNVASGNETTGMIPTPPMTQDEYDSFRMLSSMELPEAWPETHGD